MAEARTERGELRPKDKDRLMMHVRSEELRRVIRSISDPDVVHADKARIVNIAQTEQRAAPQSTIPCLLTNSEMYSYRKERCLLPTECILTHGALCDR